MDNKGVRRLLARDSPFLTDQWASFGRIVSFRRGTKTWRCSCGGDDCDHIWQVKGLEKIPVDTGSTPVVSSVQIKKPTALIDQGRKFRTE